MQVPIPVTTRYRLTPQRRYREEATGTCTPHHAIMRPSMIVLRGPSKIVIALTEVEALMLNIRFNDDFIAYVNGVEVARSLEGIPGRARRFDARSAAQEDDRNRTIVIPLSRYPGLLTTSSENVLAIQGFNGRLLSSDFVLAELELVALVPEPPAWPMAAMAWLGILVAVRRQVAPNGLIGR